MSELAHAHLEDVGRLRSALSEFTDRSIESVGDADRLAEGVVREIGAEVARRRERLAALERALSACRSDERADCTSLEQEVRRAAERLGRAQQARRSAEGAVARFVSRRARFAREAGRLAAEATVLLGRQSEDLVRYLGSTAAEGASGGAASVAAGPRGGAGGGILTPPGFPEGYAMVPLASIDATDSPVTGPESFDTGYSPADLQWACSALVEVVLPAMAAGLGRDYFRERDEAERRSGVRSYSWTYGGFFGDDRAIKLVGRPDGRYEVRNGYHRIWVATRLRHPAVPARIA
jgi:hypothetical protein